jgi:hypothetical protein
MLHARIYLLYGYKVLEAHGYELYNGYYKTFKEVHWELWPSEPFGPLTRVFQRVVNDCSSS